MFSMSSAHRKPCRFFTLLNGALPQLNMAKSRANPCTDSTAEVAFSDWMDRSGTRSTAETALEVSAFMRVASSGMTFQTIEFAFAGRGPV